MIKISTLYLARYFAPIKQELKLYDQTERLQESTLFVSWYTFLSEYTSLPSSSESTLPIT
jgi:hypothetical protein